MPSCFRRSTGGWGGGGGGETTPNDSLSPPYQKGIGESHLNVSIIANGKVTRERRAKTDPNRGPSANQPNALVLGQTGSQTPMFGLVKRVQRRVVPEEVLAGTEIPEGGGRGWGYSLTLHYHHQNGSCIKMGKDENRFNVSVIVRGKVKKTVHVHEPDRAQNVGPIQISAFVFSFHHPSFSLLSFCWFSVLCCCLFIVGVFCVCVFRG